MNHDLGEINSIYNSEVKTLRPHANAFIGKFRNYIS